MANITHPFPVLFMFLHLHGNHWVFGFPADRGKEHYGIGKQQPSMQGINETGERQNAETVAVQARSGG